jgi:hypothetical protein
VSGFGPYASAKVPDRKYLWTVVVLFALLGLVGLGVLLYRPLMLQYAMLRVRSSGYVDEPGLRARPGDRWLDTCLDAAQSGNHLAMKFLAERALLWSGATHPLADSRDVSMSRLYQAAAAQPELFTAILDRCSDQDARKLIEHVTLSCDSANLGDATEAYWRSLKGVEQSLAELTSSRSPEVQGLATATLNYTRRRFAKELAKTEKASPADPVR